MPYHGYLLYQAERGRTPAEQREADARLGQRAAALAHVFRSIARPARAPRRQTATGQPARAPRRQKAMGLPARALRRQPATAWPAGLRAVPARRHRQLAAGRSQPFARPAAHYCRSYLHNH